MVYIEDGLGTGRKAAVNDENRLLSNCTTESIEHHTNVHEGEAYNYQMSEIPSGSPATIVYIKNENDIDLVLEGMNVMNQETQMYELSLGDTGTPAGTITVTPANMNAGAGNVADGTFYTGSNMTGLTQGTVVERIWASSSSGTQALNFDMDIIVPKNQTFVVRTGITGSKTSITIPMYYHQA